MSDGSSTAATAVQLDQADGRLCHRFEEQGQR